MEDKYQDKPNKSKRQRQENFVKKDGKYYRVIHLEQEVEIIDIPSLIIGCDKKISELEYQLANEKDRLKDLIKLQEEL